MSSSGHRIAIVGAGSVGATCAYAALIRGVGSHYLLYDIDKPKVEAQAQDLRHGLQFAPAIRIDGSDDLQICKDADVVILTAGAKSKPGQTRMELAGVNVEMCRTLVPNLMNVAPNALYLIVTNPNDVITYAVLKLSGLPAQRVLGTGTVLDSSRFRHLIAQRLRVGVHSVHAYIAGEHGDSEIPLW
ncbi:MAG: lactate/malate family dehydrogenase, partial [Tepidisphaeraceae bacterium]